MGRYLSSVQRYSDTILERYELLCVRFVFTKYIKLALSSESNPNQTQRTREFYTRIFLCNESRLFFNESWPAELNIGDICEQHKKGIKGVSF